MNTIPALVLTDFYKTDHRRQFPDGTTVVYSNFTPRGSRLPGIDHVVFFGLQYFVVEYLQKRFDETFFKLPKAQAVGAYRRRLDHSLGAGAVPIDHVEALHDLGHLPLRIKALPEGSRVPIFSRWMIGSVSMLTVPSRPARVSRRTRAGLPWRLRSFAFFRS